MTLKQIVTVFFIATLPGLAIAMENQKSEITLHIYNAHKRSQSQTQKKVSLNSEVEKKQKEVYEKFEKALHFLANDTEMPINITICCCKILTTTLCIELSAKATTPVLSCSLSTLLKKTDSLIERLTTSLNLEDVD